MDGQVQVTKTREICTLRARAEEFAFLIGYRQVSSKAVELVGLGKSTYDNLSKPNKTKKENFITGKRVM